MTSNDLNLIPLSRVQFSRTWKVIEDGVQQGVTPGVVAGFWSFKRPEEVVISSWGNRRNVPTPLPLFPDTVFDLASLTKVYATATLFAVFVDRGWLDWETPLKQILADAPWKEDIRMKHLLSHTAGFPAWAPFWEKIKAEFAPRVLSTVPVFQRQKSMRKWIYETALDVQPGVRALYSDLSFILLGFVLEEVSRMPFDEAVERFLWEPLGLKYSYFMRTKSNSVLRSDERVAATEQCPWRATLLQGQVHDDNCWAMGGYGGHAGAFGNARDVLFFCKRLLTGFLSPLTLNKMWTRYEEHLDGDPAYSSVSAKIFERTLGWDTPSGEMPSASRLFSKNTVGHLGFTGTSLWIDLDQKLAVVLLTNRVHPSRENQLIRQFRPRFHQALREDLGE